MKLPLIFIVGPTCIGKSNFAISLAKNINGEIINADSMQVYSNLKILTARPSLQDHKILPHHLYGYVNGYERYNVAKWCEDISQIIKKNDKKNIYSVIVGGTGLYIDKLLNGMANIPYIPESFKKESNELLLKIGLESFYNKVFKIDKTSCERISQKDSQRLMRIWEVFQSTKKPLSEWIKTKYNYLDNINYKIFLFTPNRDEIYKRVNLRFKEMIKYGAIEEVQKLLLLNLDKSLPIMKAHGVPEISKYISGKHNIEDCIYKGQLVTRNYVKRQLTWWKASKLVFHEVLIDFPSNFDIKQLNF